MYRRRFRRAPLRRRKYVRKARGKKRVSASVKKYVKKQIHRNIENKTRINYEQNKSIVLNGTPASTTYPLIISTPQGTDAYSRTGNVIRCVKGTWKCCINLLSYNATTNPQAVPCWVKIWVLKDLKNNGQLSQMDTTAYGNLFESNLGSIPLQYGPNDLNFAINKDYFRVITTRTFKLGVTSAFNAGVPVNAGSYFDNSQMAKQITINWGKYVRKMLKFNDSTTYCQNDNLYFVIQTVPADGSSVGSGNALCEIHYVNTMEFEDA